MHTLDAEHLCSTLIDLMRPAISADTAMVGIHTGGVWLARRLHHALGLRTPLGALDISFYRDDFGSKGLHARPQKNDIPFSVDGAHIIVVDDVLFTGRTTRAALNELFDYGRPARVDLAVLIDRGGRELPIAPRFCAHTLSPELPPGQNLELACDEAGAFSLRLIDA